MHSFLYIPCLRICAPRNPQLWKPSHTTSGLSLICRTHEVTYSLQDHVQINLYSRRAQVDSSKFGSTSTLLHLVRWPPSHMRSWPHLYRTPTVNILKINRVWNAATYVEHIIWAVHMQDELPHVIYTSRHLSPPLAASGSRRWRLENNLWRVQTCVYKYCASLCSHRYLDQLSTLLTCQLGLLRTLS